jgi:sRNA-binding regulator protein Hfq
MQKSIQTKLFEAKKDKTIVLFLINGKEIKGTLRGHEQYTITIENEKGLLETYYKHAVLKVCWGKVQLCSKVLKPAPKQEQPKEA